MNEIYPTNYKIPPTPTEKCKAIAAQHQYLPAGALEEMSTRIAAGTIGSEDLDWINTVSVMTEVPRHEIHAFYFGSGIGLGCASKANDEAQAA